MPSLSPTKTLHERALEVMPGGVNSGQRQASWYRLAGHRGSERIDLHHG